VRPSGSINTSNSTYYPLKPAVDALKQRRRGNARLCRERAILKKTSPGGRGVRNPVDRTAANNGWPANAEMSSRSYRICWRGPAPQRSNRVLKNVMSAGKTRQNFAKKRSLCVINEHFEPNLNDVLPSAIVFQQPAKKGYGCRIACTQPPERNADC